MKTHKFFNSQTRQAMFERVRGYVDRRVDNDTRLRHLKQRHGLDRLYRFDLGENAEGYSPRIRQYLADLRDDDRARERLADWLNVYPDRHHPALRERLAEKYAIPADWFVIGAGLDSLLDLVTRVFLEPRDAYLMPVPSFYLFEDYSERMGAVPYFLELDEADDFRWTAATGERFRRLVEKCRPKLIWLANPNNPTGQVIDASELAELVDFAIGYNAFVVVDEAYGEYVDPPGAVNSAARLLARYPNLMVLRTFSKKYGLASLRIGYLMCSSEDIRDGLQVHRHHFPITQVSADLARIALEDDDYLETTRSQLQAHRQSVFQRLGRLRRFSMVPSATNIFMLRHREWSSTVLLAQLERHGVIASPLDISGLRGRGYCRFTLRRGDDNEYLCRVLEALDAAPPAS